MQKVPECQIKRTFHFWEAHIRAVRLATHYISNKISFKLGSVPVPEIIAKVCKVKIFYIIVSTCDID